MGVRASFERVSSGEVGVEAQFIFDTDELIVFCQPVGAAERSSFDLSGVGSDSDVGDGGVLGLT